MAGKAPNAFCLVRPPGHHAGAARGMTEAIVLTLGTGIAGGLILRDEIYRGALGAAGINILAAQQCLPEGVGRVDPAGQAASHSDHRDGSDA